MEPIFTYSDYRKYLQDYFEDQKKNHAFFSHRYFAKKAGFSTSNFLHLVMGGKRNLTKQSIIRVVQALKLNKSESEYFENLVFFNQAADIREKNLFLEKLTAFRKSTFVQQINADQFDYYSTWYHPVVREVACFNGGRMTEKEIGKIVRPRLTPREIRQSLELLLRLGFLKKEEERYVQSSPLVSTGPDVASTAVAAYHIKTMALAAEALENFKPENRDIRSLTLGITRENFDAIKKRIREFRKEILAMAQEENPDRVVQLNFHLFPLSRIN
jgi:uncharacterized protein (TIGR02147 family)